MLEFSGWVVDLGGKLRTMSCMNAYLSLLLAVVFEVMATSLVKLSDGFTNLLPTAALLVFYGISFYLMSLAVKVIPIGIAYAVWSGFGIIIISLIGLAFFKQHLDLPAVCGIALILVGVLVINLFSKMSGH